MESQLDCITMKCISILNYMVHNVNDLPPNLAYFLFKEKNILNLLISLLELKPWIKKTINPITK